MAHDVDPLRQILPLLKVLEGKGLQPVLVGGMAMVVLGSQRVTKDFDFLVASADLKPDMVEAIYAQGYQLIAKLKPTGEVARTVDNPKVAAARLRLDKPRSAFFCHRKTGLRIDLLLDFPLPARDIAGKAATIGRKSSALRVAAPEDLLRLKKIAYTDRKSASDAQDLEFLRHLLSVE